MSLRSIYILLVLIPLLSCEREDNTPVEIDFAFIPGLPLTTDEVNLEVMLTGPASLDTTEYIYRWDWDSDGEFDTRYSAQTSLNRKFTEPGDYTVNLEALHTSGTKYTATHNITVNQGYSAPVPDYSFTPDSGNFKTVFTFDASATSDEQEDIDNLTFRWDFNEDNRWDTVGIGDPVARHSFPGKGLYPVKLMVSDTSNLHNEIVKTVYVNQLDTLIRPVLRFEPEFPGDRDTILIIATDSYYEGKPEMILRYSFKPFGAGWTEPISQSVFHWTLPPPGIFNIQVRVYSDEGLYNTGEKEIVISRTNRKPTAVVTRNLRFGNILSTFEFSAWGSFDVENVPSELRARWDFEGDGVWDTQFSYEKVVTRVYQDPGKYDVKMQIVDQEGLRDIATTDIHVSPHTNPISSFKDIRDEQIYSMVQIAGRWWMGENLNFKPKEKSGYGPDKSISWCFNDNPNICEVAGRLYFASTIRSDYSGNTVDENICPKGWHLPTRDEWVDLILEYGFEIGGKELFYGGKSDFNALLGGYAAYYRYDQIEEFYADSLYQVAYFMTAEIGTSTATTIQIVRNQNEVNLRQMPAQGYYSIRCIRDE